MGHIMTIEELNSYYSQNFSIICERMPDTIQIYQFVVKDSYDNTVIDHIKNVGESKLDAEFEQLKAKYIFDYDAKLKANQIIKKQSDKAQSDEKKILKN